MTDLKVREAVTTLVAFFNEAEAAHKATHFPSLRVDKYWVASGRKYIKIAHGSDGQCDGGGGSVHCFVDALTGDVYKAGSWKAPALNGSRFNILDEASFDDLKAKWDPYGGYLYKTPMNMRAR